MKQAIERWAVRFLEGRGYVVIRPTWLGMVLSGPYAAQNDGDQWTVAPPSPKLPVVARLGAVVMHAPEARQGEV